MEAEKQQGNDRVERQADLAVAASGYGTSSYCPEGIPVETALFAILSAFAVAFGILFTAITMITMGGRRKKRRSVGTSSAGPRLSLRERFWVGRYRKE